MADRLVRAADHHSRFYENGKKCILNVLLNLQWFIMAPIWGDLTGVAGHPNYHVKVVKLKYYVDGRVTSPKRVTSPTWGPPPPCTRALR